MPRDRLSLLPAVESHRRRTKLRTYKPLRARKPMRQRRARPRRSPRQHDPAYLAWIRTLSCCCPELGADLELTCSDERAGTAETIARGVLVGIFTDRELTSRRIADGFGFSQAVVVNLRHQRRCGRPEWEALIAKYATKD